MSPPYLLGLLILFFPLALSQTPPCPSGHYSTQTSFSPPTFTCVPCPAGTYLPTSGAVALDLCIECPPNTFSTVLGATSSSTCTPCPAGLASGSGANECLSCNPGSRIQPCPFPRNIVRDGVSMQFFRGECFFFPDGPDPFVSPAGVQNARCERCPRETISSQPNSLRCERCPRGLTPNQNRTMCVPPTCPPGQGLMGGVCRRCGNGLIADEDRGICVPCPNGEVASTIRGVRECRPCREGTARLFTSFCATCSPEENQNVTGAQFCLPEIQTCPFNFFVGNGGACLTCSKRQRYDAASNTCVACQLNSFSNGGLDNRCRRCRRGMIASSFQDVCVCQRGWGWVPGSGRTRCAKCRPGTASIGDQFCRPCQPDFFAPEAGMAFCNSCELGFTQPRYGQRRCIPRRCPPGLVPSEHAGCVLPTTNCPPGQDRSEIDGLLPDCVPRSAANCTEGTVLVRRDFGPPICSTCGRGQRYDRSLEMCIRCPEGTTSAGGAPESCQPCPRGLIFVDGECRCSGGRSLVRGRCRRCRSGTFGYRNVDGCRPCLVGTASNRTGRTSMCEPCPAGTFAGNRGRTECLPCTEGTTTFGIGESSCFTLA